MLFTKTIAVAVALAPLANAHGSTGLPRILGLDMLDRRVESLTDRLNLGGLFGTEGDSKSILEARASGQECGEGIGSCPEDRGCCSIAGYCGTNSSYCSSPGCNYKYGPGCPENQRPEGKDTSLIPRAKIGSVAYGGSGISKCKNPGTVALTYDDGPHKDFTNHILDLFKKYDAKATFFITGNNNAKGQIDKTQEHIDAIKRMDTEGHQIASHTWTHLDLSKISSEDRKKQAYYVEMALNNIVGKIPTYLRPPYISCNADCQQDMSDLGYHLIYWDVSTDDYEQAPKNTFQNSLDWFKGNITKNGATPESNDWLAISHDIVEKTAYNLTEYMLSTLTELGYKAVTVGECLGDPEDNWYRQFGDSADRTGNTSSTSTSASSSGSRSASPSSSSSAGSPQSSSSPSSGAAPEQITSSANSVQLPYLASVLLLSAYVVLGR